jgi:hypothetical protein
MTDDKLAAVRQKHNRKKTEATKHLANNVEKTTMPIKVSSTAPKRKRQYEFANTLPLRPWRIMNTCQTRVTFSSMK